IHREAVERVGRQRDDLPREDPLRRLFDRVALRRPGIDEHPSHDQTVSTIVRHTTIAHPPMIARLTRNTARMLVPASSPATSGRTAIPVSDALVSTPRPVPCAPAGMTRPAALYDAVIAAPMPTPKRAAAPFISHTFPVAPRRPAPRAAAAAPAAITGR